MDLTLLKELPDSAITSASQREGMTTEDLRSKLPKNHPFLWLDSRSGGPCHLLLGKTWELQKFSDHLQVTHHGITKKFQCQLSFRETLDHLHEDWLPKQPTGLELAFLLSYEAGWEEEERRTPRPFFQGLPLWSIFCPREVLLLNGDGTLTHLHGEQLLFDVEQKPCVKNPNFAEGLHIQSTQSQEDYLSQVHSLKEHIRRGDSFQVNLSQALLGLGQVNAFDWAQHAIPKEGGGFSALWQEPDFQVMSLSPERLLRIEGQRLITRPIAGTLPRHPDETQESLRAFVAHPKELAEHNMLIDLERNDLGKVSIPGSVEITEKLTIETLPHVHHLVSQVEGTLKEGCGYGTALSAVFPGGTITGCPKLETMHLLDTHEKGPRGPYTGSLGYMSRDTLDSNILIRSALVRNSEVQMRFGGGIVWDSDPEKEYLETIAKSRGIVQSLLEGGAKVDPDHRSLRQFFP